MSLPRQKITSYLLNNNLFFVEIIAVALPLLLFSGRSDAALTTIIIKNLTYIWLSLLGVKLLAPTIYQAYETNSKFKHEPLLKKLHFYLKVIGLFCLLLITTKLLKNHLSPHNFSLLLITLFLKILVVKSELDKFSTRKLTILRLCYLTTLIFLSSLVFLELILLPAGLIAISVGCLLTAVSLIELYNNKNASSSDLRISGILYLMHAGLQAIYVILQITYPWHFLGLFLTPLIVKMSPVSDSEITPENLCKYSKLNILLFVLFLGIMLFIKS